MSFLWCRPFYIINLVVASEIYPSASSLIPTPLILFYELGSPSHIGGGLVGLLHFLLLYFDVCFLFGFFSAGPRRPGPGGALGWDPSVWRSDQVGRSLILTPLLLSSGVLCDSFLICFSFSFTFVLGGPFASQYEICVEVERGQPASTKVRKQGNRPNPSCIIAMPCLILTAPRSSFFFSDREPQQLLRTHRDRFLFFFFSLWFLPVVCKICNGKGRNDDWTGALRNKAYPGTLIFREEALFKCFKC